MNFGETVAAAVAGDAIKRIYPHLVKAMPLGKSHDVQLSEKSLARHLTYVSRWAEQYNFLGLSSPKDSRSETIPLRLTNVPRRYRGNALADDTPDLHEDAFLSARDCLVLLGDPGAGKTTSLKRLCLQLLGEPAQNELGFQVPLLVVLRELDRDTSIIPYLADVLGITVDNPATDQDRTSPRIYGFDAVEKIGEFLDAMGAVLIVDGLDELPSDQRSAVERELQALNTFARYAKIIVSCRSGDYNRPMQGFSVYEILPLSNDEVRRISESWLGDASQFFDHLNSKPYRDIIDRPLLLSFLLFLFKNEGALPARPSQNISKGCLQTTKRLG
ncbi:MAG: hypothetical protein JWL96_1449 [Sphingomonas bacterium]|uniref:NACHT domain-containing protein n=1 Tax=Sphingomonas bacterium TaxID=1895847 RepID=UPI00260E13D4|nr:NACHT domain-containing protein [Sphingomonas bacterium]MDB5709379.1 hypothetical protein [Sphingomonas bacterium]